MAIFKAIGIYLGAASRAAAGPISNFFLLKDDGVVGDFILLDDGIAGDKLILL